MGAVQDGAGAAAASSQGIGGMGGELVAGFVVVPKTSAQLRPGPGEVGAPGSVSPWLPPSPKESRRVGACAAIDATCEQPLAARVCGTGQLCTRSAKGLPLAQVGQHRRTVACIVEQGTALALLIPG